MGMPLQQGGQPGMAFNDQPQGAPPFFPGGGGSPPFLPQVQPLPAASFQQSAQPGAPPFFPGPMPQPSPQNQQQRMDQRPGIARGQAPPLQTPPSTSPRPAPQFVPDLSMSPEMNLQTLRDTGQRALDHPAWQEFLFGNTRPASPPTGGVVNAHMFSRSRGGG